MFLCLSCAIIIVASLEIVTDENGAVVDADSESVATTNANDAPPEIPRSPQDLETFQTALTAFCTCNPEDDHSALIWQAIVFDKEYQCWAKQRKIPGILFANMWRLYTEHLQNLGSGKIKMYQKCPAGALNLVLLLLSVLEVHDMNDATVVDLLDPALAIWEGRGLEDFLAETGEDVSQTGVANNAFNTFINYGHFVGKNFDQISCSDVIPDTNFPWVFDVNRFEHLAARLRRKLDAWYSLLYSNNGEPPRERELRLEGYDPARDYAMISAKNSNKNSQSEKSPSLALCILYGDGAKSLKHTLETWRETGLLEHSSERFILYLNDSDEENPDKEKCWRRKIEKQFNLTVLNFDYYSFPDTFVGFGKKAQYRRTGRAMTSCAMKAESDHIMFLEEDWEVIARPKQLALHRIIEAQKLLERKSDDEMTDSKNEPVHMVHLRHKYFYGQPYYELLTSGQHNEPPPASLALYFSEDPVEEKFPYGAWSPPFNEGGKTCDSGRASWYESLDYQVEAREEAVALNGDSGSEKNDSSMETKTVEAGARLPLIEWCHENSASICTTTRTDDDPFRNVFYTTNPTLYKRKFWIKHFAAQVAVLGDARAIEESITVSYQWRVSPGYRVAYSPGLFRHKRVDRDTFEELEDDQCEGFDSDDENDHSSSEQPFLNHSERPDIAENREMRRESIEHFYGQTRGKWDEFRI